VLVVGLRADPRTLLARASRRQAASQQESLSSPLYLFGKLLDALLLDRVENDLANLRRVNAALRALTPVLLQDRSSRSRCWRPAARCGPCTTCSSGPARTWENWPPTCFRARRSRAPLRSGGYLMRRIGENAVETQDPSDLLSYLLFDGEYARELIALGERDAHEVREELDAFLAAA